MSNLNRPMSRRKPRKGQHPGFTKEPANGFEPQAGRKLERITGPRPLLFGFCIICLVSAIAVFILVRRQTSAEAESLDAPYVPRSPGTITFNKDVASIIFTRCAPCHHSGQPAPFELLTYRDIAKRARQIVEVTQSNYMPPWLPEHGFGQF